MASAATPRPQLTGTALKAAKVMGSTAYIAAGQKLTILSAPDDKTFQITTVVDGATVEGQVPQGLIALNIPSEAAQAVTAVTAGKQTVLRQKPETKGKSVATLQAGQSVELRAAKDSWYEVATQVKGKTVTGWLPAEATAITINHVALEAPAPAPAPAPAIAKGASCSDLVGNLMATRPMSAMELREELKSLRGGFSLADPGQTLNALLTGGPAPKANAPQQKAAAADPMVGNCPGNQLVAALAAQSAQRGSTGSLWMDIASKGSDLLLDALVSELSYAAIDAFLQQMLDSPDVMTKVVIDIPELSMATPDLRQKTLNLASYLAALKASNLMVESAQKEFENAKASYKRVMDYHEKAATVLKQAILNKERLRAALQEQQARGLNMVDEGELARVAEIIEKAPEDFFKDYQVQRVAISYIRSQDEYAPLVAEMEGAYAEFKGHYGAYSRTAVGVGSMVGFGAQFLKKSKNMLEQQGGLSAPILLPMITQGLKEVGALAINLQSVFDSSSDINEGSFLVEKAGSVDKRGISFSRAVGRLDDGAAQSVRDNLIREDRDGYVSKLYQHARDHAAAMADRMVGKEQKKALALAFEIDEPDAFSFQNVLRDSSQLASEKKRRIGETLLIAQKGGVGDAEGAAAEAAQAQLRTSLDKLSNGDARRLLFASAASTGNQWITAADYRIGIDNLGMEGLNDHLDFLATQSKNATVRTTEKAEPDTKPAQPTRGKRKK